MHALRSRPTAHRLSQPSSTVHAHPNKIRSRGIVLPPPSVSSHLASTFAIPESPVHTPLRPVLVATADAQQPAPSSLNVRPAHTLHHDYQPLQSHEQPPPAPSPGPERQDEISDQEWDIRTGRAIYLLQKTLPDFFRTGLVTSLSLDTGEPVAASLSGGDKHKRQVNGIYSPRIRLAYTPLVPLPAPFPRTLHVEGLPLYLASSVFVRHTLNALYTDLAVELRRVRVHGPSGPPPNAGPLPPPLSEQSPSQTPDSAPLEGSLAAGQAPRKVREKTLVIGLSVSGVARVSGALGGWDVNSTYAFSPSSGLVQTHTVDSIEPAPHQAVFDALRAALGFGQAPPGGAGAGPVARSR